MIHKKALLFLAVFILSLSSVFSFRIMQIQPGNYANLSNQMIANYILTQTHTTGYAFVNDNLEYYVTIPRIDYYFDNSNQLNIWLSNMSNTIRIPLSLIRVCLANYNISICQQYILYASQNYTINISGIIYYVEPASYQLGIIQLREYNNALWVRNYTQNWLVAEQERQLFNQFANVTI